LDVDLLLALINLAHAAVENPGGSNALLQAVCGVLGTTTATVTEREALLEAFDRAQTAVFVVNAEARVILANRVGQRLLRSGDGLVFDRGRLRAARPETAPDLHRLLNSAATARGGDVSAIARAGSLEPVSKPRKGRS
jgi:hypothetical protein